MAPEHPPTQRQVLIAQLRAQMRRLETVAKLLPGAEPPPFTVEQLETLSTEQLLELRRDVPQRLSRWSGDRVRDPYEVRRIDARRTRCAAPSFILVFTLIDLYTAAPIKTPDANKKLRWRPTSIKTTSKDPHTPPFRSLTVKQKCGFADEFVYMDITPQTGEITMFKAAFAIAVFTLALQAGCGSTDAPLASGDDASLCDRATTVIEGDFSVGSASELEALAPADGECFMLAGSLTIRDESGSLNNLTPLSRLTAVTGNLRIHLSPKLKSLSALSSLERVNGDLAISYNSSLSSLDGLHNLVYVGNGLWVQGDRLTDLEGLSSLVTVESFLAVRDNPRLVSFDGLTQLTRLGGLLIHHNEALEDMSALHQITTTRNTVSIVGNPSLRSLVGLSALQTVEGNLVLQENRRLETLNGLEALTRVGWDLAIPYVPIYGETSPHPSLV